MTMYAGLQREWVRILIMYSCGGYGMEYEVGD